MQKNDRYYAFLFTHSSRNRIFIRRVEVSKRVLRSCAAASLIGICAAAFSVSNLIKQPNSFFTEAATASVQEPNSVNKAYDWVKGVVNQVSVENKTVQQAPIEQVQTNEVAQVTKPNYENAGQSISANSNDVTLNSGGPSTPFQLTNESEEEENQIAQQLDSLQKTLDPSYLPTMWAHLGKINNEFGFRRNPFGGRNYEFHSGLDINGEKGDIVVAPANGTIIKAGWVSGYGNLIEISHGGGLTSRYGHLSKILIQVGDTIERGQEIGLVGSTGRSTGPHLHYELRLNNKSINPRRFLPTEPSEIRALAEK
jgi:murein DD-endopeptidase MepM/ murein hydrolase activator NlpD